MQVPDSIDAFRLTGVCLQGQAIERFAQMTNWDYYEAARRFQKVLEAAGINKALTKKGVLDGDTVVIGELSLEWSHDQVMHVLLCATLLRYNGYSVSCTEIIKNSYLTIVTIRTKNAWYVLCFSGERGHLFIVLTLTLHSH